MTRMQEITLRQFAETFFDFVTKLLGPKGQTMWWPAFKVFLRQENPWDGRSYFPVWRTVTVGKSRSYQDLILALQNARIDVSDVSSLCLRKMFFESEKRQIDLMLINVGDLGFVRGAPYYGIFKEIKRRGLRLCSAEMLVEARLAYNEQASLEDVLVVATNPIDYGPDEIALRLETSKDKSGHSIGHVTCDSFSGPNEKILCCYPY